MRQGPRPLRACTERVWGLSALGEPLQPLLEAVEALLDAVHAVVDPLPELRKPRVAILWAPSALLRATRALLESVSTPPGALVAPSSPSASSAGLVEATSISSSHGSLLCFRSVYTTAYAVPVRGPA